MKDRVMKLTVNTAKALNEVAEEIKRSRSKFPGNEDMMIALTEEVGELAKDLLHHKYEPKKGKTNASIRAEAIQVATMAIRIATEGDGGFPYDPSDLTF